MKFFKLLTQLSLVIFLLASCADGEFFGENKPPLPGKRINVLHYDSFKEKTPNQNSIIIPAQTNLLGWVASDVGQFTGLPDNITLNKQLKLTDNFHPNNFTPSIYDSAVIIIDEILYTYTKCTLSAYNLIHKKNLWAKEVLTGKEKDDVLGGSIAYADGIIYVSSGNRDFVAYEADTGKELWRFNAPNVVRHIALVDNNQIYVNSTDNTLSCLDLNGKLLWRYDGTIYSLITSRLYIPNIVFEDKVITISTAGDLVVLNRYNGMELTQVNLATTSIIGDGNLAKGPISSPLLYGHHLYILTGENDLVKIDLKNPQILWRQNFSGAKDFWVADETTYLLTENNQLLAINNFTSELIWAIDLPKDENKKDFIDFYGPVLAGDQLILTAANGEFFLISPENGKLVTKHKNNFPTRQIPFIVNDKAYFIGNNGNIAVWK